jgi:UDP-3-O-[3-hydroxymyristoyl] glucosamine N-acyltransferase
MKFTSLELSKLVAGKLIGSKHIILTGVSSLLEASKHDISFLRNSKYITDAIKSQAGVIFVSKEMDISKLINKNLIQVKRADYAYNIILNLISKCFSDNKIGIDKFSYIAPHVTLGDNVYIGRNVVIETKSVIGNNVNIFPNVYIGENVQIGNNCTIYPNVVIRYNTKIGKRVIIHPGVIIGGDGFGFICIHNKWCKVPHIGKVDIGDDVEIGANTTIDRATVGITKIGNGTKIDNLVQIAHNVKIGENCVIVAQVGIAGSTQLGNNVQIGGKSGIVGHLKIGNNVMIASQAGISKNVKDNAKVGGNPMTSLNKSLKIKVLMRKLPEIYKDLKKLKKFFKK